MKAVQIALVLLCINAGLFIVNATDVWNSEDLDVGGAKPQDIENQMVLENKTGNREAFSSTGLDSLQNLILGNKLTLGVIVGAILLSGLTLVQTQVTTPRVVGILIFVIVFSILLGNLTGVLQLMEMPASLVTVITGFNYFWMVLAVIQLATGSSLRVLQ